MKVVLVAVLVVVALAVAAPQNKDAVEPPKIIRSEFDQQPDGSYNFDFETDDGTKRNENGELKQVLDEENKPHDVVVVRGSYTYLDENQKPNTINYYADETGFHAEGDSIPKQAR